MPFKIIKNDLTTLEVDAIVNPTDIFFSGGGGVDEKIHLAAGKELREELNTKEQINVSEATITNGYNLKCKKIIHVAGPIWYDGNHNEQILLANSYINCLKVAKENNIQSIAFPLISTGTFSFPKEIGLEIATNCFTSFLLEEEMDIYLVVYDKESIAVSEKVFGEIQEFITDCFQEEFNKTYSVSYSMNMELEDELPNEKDQEFNYSKVSISKSKIKNRFEEDEAIEAINKMHLEKTFTEKLLSIIDKKGLKDSKVYKKANIDRRLFSKIRSNTNYKPTKKTAIALCLALELDYYETQDLLSRTNLALARSDRFDIVIEYCIKNKIYNIIYVNQILYNFDLDLL